MYFSLSIPITVSICGPKKLNSFVPSSFTSILYTNESILFITSDKLFCTASISNCAFFNRVMLNAVPSIKMGLFCISDIIETFSNNQTVSPLFNLISLS